MKITNATHFADLSNEDYHAHGKDVISSSFVKDVCKHSISKALEPTKISPALIFGSAFHTGMEEDGLVKVKKDFTLLPAVDKRTKKYKDAIEKVKKDGVSEQRIISQFDFYQIQKMVRAAYENEVFKSMNKEHDFADEHSFFGDYNGVRYRIRPDRLYKNPFTEEPFAIVDYKSCQDVYKFKRDIFIYRYDVQAIFYSLFLDIDPRNFYFLAVEKEKPFSTQMYRLSDETIKRATDDMYNALRLIEQWKQTGNQYITDKPLIIEA